jgi:hypothetical protein
MPTNENTNKANTALRYLGTGVSGGLSVFVALGTLSPEQQTQILSSAHIMYQSTHDFIGAAANLWYIVFPIVAIWLGKLGVNSSGFGAMMDKIFAAAKAGDQNAKVTIVSAAASKEIGTVGIVNPALAADPATPDNVVKSASLVNH